MRSRDVLVYASTEADPVHAPARALVEALAKGPELVYLVWNRPDGLPAHRDPSRDPAKPAQYSEAMGNVAALLSLGHVRAPGETDTFWEIYRSTAGNHVRGNTVPDAHLAALMRQHGVTTIYTRDRDFRRVDGIRVEDPFA